MTARVVPLGSAEAGDARVAGTTDERLALVHELTARMWSLTGKPLPTYERHEMPVTLSRLVDQ